MKNILCLLFILTGSLSLLAECKHCEVNQPPLNGFHCSLAQSAYCTCVPHNPSYCLENINCIDGVCNYAPTTTIAAVNGKCLVDESVLAEQKAQPWVTMKGLPEEIGKQDAFMGAFIKHQQEVVLAGEVFGHEYGGGFAPNKDQLLMYEAHWSAGSITWMFTKQRGLSQHYTKLVILNNGMWSLQ